VNEEIYSKLVELSFQATGISSPNPPVACVITEIDGNIISTGYTQIIGNNHAEREAYSNFKNVPHYTFVTLEPCTHFGRTPPCLDLILQQKPKKLFIGNLDQNPIVKKNSNLQKLSELGIEVILDENIKKISDSFLEGFFSRFYAKITTFY